MKTLHIRSRKIMRKAQVEARNAFKGEKNNDEAGLVELEFLKMVIKKRCEYILQFRFL